MSGYNDYTGNVEICLGGMWGTVSSSCWDDIDAK